MDWRNTLVSDPIVPDPITGNLIPDESKQAWEDLRSNGFVPWLLSYTGDNRQDFRSQIEQRRTELAGYLGVNEHPPTGPTLDGVFCVNTGNRGLPAIG